MVRWIQEQMGGLNSHGSSDSCSSSGGAGDRDPKEVTAASGAPPRESLAQAKLEVQQLVDGLSAAILQERSKAQALALEAAGGSRQIGGDCNILKLALNLDELRQHTEKQQLKQSLTLRSEEARLRKELALKNAVFRAYLTECKNSDLPQTITQVDSVSDSCLVPTLVL